jgi:putative phosphoesterase
MICLVSDTHENLPAIRVAVPMMVALKPTLVIHCGDIISPPTVEEFRGLPMRFVFGNNDGERDGLRRKCEELGFGDIADELEISLGGKHLYVTHGTRPSALDAKIDSQAYDYIFHGHTHRRRNEKIGNTRVINPGALFQASAYSFASLELAADEVRFYDVKV